MWCYHGSKESEECPGGIKMSTQVFVWMVAVFVLGLFLGSNLGVVLMCLLQVAGGSSPANAELASIQVPTKD
jgi:hypothetical protein